MTRIPYHIVLMSISILIILVLLMGVPTYWKDALLIGVAVMLFVLGLAFRKEMQKDILTRDEDISHTHAFQDSDTPVVDFEETVVIQDNGGSEDVQVIRTYSRSEENEE